MHDEKTKEKVQVIVDVMQFNATYLYFWMCVPPEPRQYHLLFLSVHHTGHGYLDTAGESMDTGSWMGQVSGL